MDSLSAYGVTHPPRSNPPLRSSSGPPSPCITPSTETCVTVVSFMVAVPFSFAVLLSLPLGLPLIFAVLYAFALVQFVFGALFCACAVHVAGAVDPAAPVSIHLSPRSFERWGHTCSHPEHSS